MDNQVNGSASTKLDDEKARMQRRVALKATNERPLDNSGA
jgi:hypothetical protein